MTKKYITQLSYDVIGCAIVVHKNLGPGLLESIYQKCLVYELKKKGMSVIQQLNVPIIYDGFTMDVDLRLDILVNDLIIVELKASETLHPVYDAQLLTYMKLLQKPQGLLINFHTDNLTKSYKPFVNEYFRLLPDE